MAVIPKNIAAGIYGRRPVVTRRRLSSLLDINDSDGIFRRRLLKLERSATFSPASQRSTSSDVINITGMTFSWIGFTRPLDSVAMMENGIWSPMFSAS